MSKKKGLGKGLDALLGGGASSARQAEPAVKLAPAPTAPETVTQTDAPLQQSLEQFRHIAVEQCQRGQYQPRRDMDPDALEELAASIRSQGIMQPITVRPLPVPVGQVQYEIIAGERRWRAAQLAGLPTVPAIVRPVSDEAAIAMAVIENLQREDLNPIEEAYALDRLQREFELTHKQVAEAVGKSRAAVTNALRLLSLQPEVRLMLENGDIEMGHARALLGLPQEQQLEAAEQVVDRGLSVRQAEALVRNWQQPAAPAVAKEPDPNIRRLEEDLSEKLGVPVALQHNDKGGGKIVLKYTSLDELDGILAHIK